MLIRTSLFVAAALCAANAAVAQTPASQPATGAQTAPAKDEGIPVQSDLVRSRCGGCHRSDDQKRMSRISYRRATPENWEKTIKRMVTLNHATLEPADARAILKYLADNQGLAPDEQRPIAYEAERRTIEYAYTADKNTADTCSSCHSMARVLSERRTKEEWELLVAMHRGYYPLVDNQPMNGGQGFRRTRPTQTEPDADGRPPDNRHPMDKALEHLEKTLPLTTPAWSAWSAAMQPPKLAGQWTLVGTGAGQGTDLRSGHDHGRTAAPPTRSRPKSATRSRAPAKSYREHRKASSTRATSGAGRGAAAGSEAPWREVMFVERGWNEMWGRWFTGLLRRNGYRRAPHAPERRTDRASARAQPRSGRGNVHARVEDFRCPPAIHRRGRRTSGWVPGVKVTRIVSAKPDEITVDVDVDRGGADRRPRPFGRRHGQARSARGLRQDRRHSRAAARGYGPRRRRCVSQAAAAVRGRRRSTTGRTASPIPLTT